LVRNKYDTGVVLNKHNHKLRPREEWIITEGRVPAIIPREQFQRAIEMRHSKVNHINQRGIYRGTSVFAQKIFCSKCGSTYTRNIDRGRIFYNCSTKKMRGKSYCDNINVQETELNEYIEWIRKTGLIDSFIREKDSHIEKFKKKIASLKEAIDQPQLDKLIEKKDELSSINEEDKRLVKVYVKGEITEDIYNEMKFEIDERKKSVEMEIAELSKSNDVLLLDIQKVEAKIAKLKTLEIKNNYSFDEVLELVQRFIISKYEEGGIDISIELSVFDEIESLNNE
jgi:hypothetical protein